MNIYDADYPHAGHGWCAHADPALHEVDLPRPPGHHDHVSPHRRAHGRGHRSQAAVLRRSGVQTSQVRHGFVFPPAGDSEGGQSLEESSPNLFNLLGFTVYFINIQSIISAVKRASLAAELERLSPDIVGLNETWLDSSVSQLEIPGYTLVSRRDRPKTSVGKLNHGGIALYHRCGGILVTHLEDSTIAERSWHVVHTDVGGLLLGLWYRPPGSAHCHIESVDSEMERLGEGMIGTLLVGDINVWHKAWLRHSPADTLEGERLHTICKEHALKQLVQEPTRGRNLLDLALSSLHGHSSATVQPAIADHAGVLVTVDLPAPTENVTERVVWDYKFANWKSLNAELTATNFDQFLRDLDVDNATKIFTEKVLEAARRHIPSRKIREHKGTHPWLNDVCRRAIAEKHSRLGFDDYDEACHRCTEILKENFADYIQKLRGETKALHKGSKKWWSLSKALMDGSQRRTGIPSLRGPSGAWIHDAKGKADLFADVFTSKFTLPDEVAVDPALFREPERRMSSFVLVRERWVKRQLRSLREDQATGPDDLPARLLIACAESLARSVTRILRKSLFERRWPSGWKIHRLSPLYKKSAVHKPDNYRGLHLTSVLSKVAERVLNIPFGKFVDVVDAFGASQWAFRKKRGCTDLVLLLICSWLREFQSRRKVGVFLGDISGAFDRVDAEKMVQKLRRIGVCDSLIDLFTDYLAPRRANVGVDGAFSYEFALQNMLFQGTVFGPPLWNIFFADVHSAAESTGCRERRFADDLNTSKVYKKEVRNEDILDDLRACQVAVHRWGEVNRVAFDPAKEEFAILSATDGHGEPFRLLGPLIDQKLLMNECIDKLYRKAKPKARALLRCRRFFSLFDLLVLFEAHVRSQIEWCNGAIYHAAPSKLAWLDSVQNSFLNHLGLGDRDAFLRFNLAPLQLRRDVGMLGALWKVSRGIAHPDLCALFPLCPIPPLILRTRADHRRHRRQFVDPCDGTQLQQFSRSLFGLIKVWNVLPTEFVDTESVSNFQTKLTGVARFACRDDAESWQHMFSVDSLPFTLLVRYCFV